MCFWQLRITTKLRRGPLKIPRSIKMVISFESFLRQLVAWPLLKPNPFTCQEPEDLMADARITWPLLLQKTKAKLACSSFRASKKLVNLIWIQRHISIMQHGRLSRVSKKINTLWSTLIPSLVPFGSKIRQPENSPKAHWLLPQQPRWQVVMARILFQKFTIPSSIQPRRMQILNQKVLTPTRIKLDT